MIYVEGKFPSQQIVSKLGDVVDHAQSLPFRCGVITEKSGRVHTSAASVVILPQANEVTSC